VAVYDHIFGTLRCRLGRAATIPSAGQRESFDFDAIPALNKKLVLDLARAEFVGRRENVIALGPSGVGKTHVSLGIGLAQHRQREGSRRRSH